MRKFLIGAAVIMALSQINAEPNPNFQITKVEPFAGGSISFPRNGDVQLHLAKSEQLLVKIYSSLGKEVLDLSGNYSGTNLLVLAGRIPTGRYIVTVRGTSFKTIKPVTVR
jgi:hypothetical protein